MKRSILFLADGARPDVLQEELKAGHLPHLARYFAQTGTVESMVSVFPSTTGPAYLPYLTGRHPGECNVPGIRWFDKGHYARKGWGFRSFRSYVGLETMLLPFDMAPHVSTFFETAKKPVSILNNIHRGFKKGVNKTSGMRIWYVYYAHLTDRWAFVDSAMTEKALEALDDDFDFMFVVFPAIDEYSHRSSPFNVRVRQAYRELDANVGKIIDKLKLKGWYDDTLLAIVADHGLSETHTHFDIGPFLETKGVKTFFYTNIFKFNFEAASMVSGNGMTHLYFKNKGGWAGRATYEDLQSRKALLDELCDRPEIAIMACQGADGSVHLLNERGHGRYKVTGDKIDYSWEGADPLGIWTEGPVSLSADASIDATFDSHFPDVFMQLHWIFASPRCGDLIVSAKPGYDLRERYEHPEHKASHGSLCPEHMLVPLLTNIPFERPKNRKHIRSMDVFSFIQKHLGQNS